MPQEVEVWEPGRLGLRRAGTRRLDPGGVRAWAEGTPCLWRRHGVWVPAPGGTGRVLRPDYFSHVRGRPVDFARDYFRPFANRYARAIREADPDAIIFMQADPTGDSPVWGPEDAQGVVFAPHWYDAAVLFFKDYSPWLAASLDGKPVFGPRAIRRSFAAQLGGLKAAARERLGGVPTLIGEFGIAFDMQGGRAYRSGDWSAQVAAMERSMRAMDDNLLSWTLWNYTADNTNARGDQWNGEDLSLFSRDQQADPADIHSGGRALQAAIRPYARATAGEPLRQVFDRRRGHFVLEFRPDPAVTAPTEVFVPGLQYPNGCRLEV